MSTYTEQLEDRIEQLMSNNALLEKKIFELENILVRDIKKEVDAVLDYNRDYIKYMFSIAGTDALKSISEGLCIEYKAEVNKVLLEIYKSGKYD